MTVRLLFVLRRRWPVLIIVPLLGACMGFFFTPRGAAKAAVGYSSKATITVNQSATTPTQVQQTLIEAEQGSIAQAIAKAAGGDITAVDVNRRLVTAFDDQSYVVVLEVKGNDRDDAEAFAKVVADTFVSEANGAPAQERADRLLAATSERDSAKDELDTFLDQNAPILQLSNPPPSVLVEQERLESAYKQAEDSLAAVRNNVEGTQEIYSLVNVAPGAVATASKLQLPASLALRVTLGLFFGVVGALVLVAIVEKVNPRIDDPETATELIGAPVLAMVPVMKRSRRALVERPRTETFSGPFAESFRSMRSHLDFRMAAEKLKVPPRIMITSATPGEGKSTSAAFLALSYAEVERPPVIIGADLRRPTIHKFFEVPRVPGLSSRAVLGGSTVPLGEIVTRDLVTGVSVVASGPSIDRVTGLVTDLTVITEAGQKAGRVVLVDTAPVMVANDAVDFLQAVDWVLVVVRIGRSTERAVKQMMKTLNLNEARVVGIVMVGSLESADAKRYYYSYYSDREGQQRAANRTTTLLHPEEGAVAVSGTVDANR